MRLTESPVLQNNLEENTLALGRVAVEDSLSSSLQAPPSFPPWSAPPLSKLFASLLYFPQTRQSTPLSKDSLVSSFTRKRNGTPTALNQHIHSPNCPLFFCLVPPQESIPLTWDWLLSSSGSRPPAFLRTCSSNYIPVLLLLPGLTERCSDYPFLRKQSAP